MAGSYTEAFHNLNWKAMLLTLTFTGDSSTGAFPAYTMPAQHVKTLQGMDVVLVTVTPGTTAPTDGFKVAITSGSGIDVMGGVLDICSSTEAGQFTPLLNGSGTKRVIDGNLTITPSGSTVASATITIKIYFKN